MKALIVDDEQPVRSSIRLLADWSVYDIEEVFEAETVEQALICIRRNSPQLVITDIRMPQHDGLELMRWLHRNRPKTQVIVISAYNEFDYAIQAIRLGALDYLLKPIQPAQLDAVLRKATQMLQFRHVDADSAILHPDVDERIWLALYLEGDAELSAHNSLAQLLPLPTGLMILDLFCVAAVEGAEHTTKKAVFSALRERMEKDGALALLGVNDQNRVYLLLSGSAEAQVQAAERALALLRESFGITPTYELRCGAVWDHAELPAVAGQLLCALDAQKLVSHPGAEPFALPAFPTEYFDAAAHGKTDDAQRILSPLLARLIHTSHVTSEDFRRWWNTLCGCCGHYLQTHPDTERINPAFLVGQTMLPVLNGQMHLDEARLEQFLHSQAQCLSSRVPAPQEFFDVCTQVRKEIQTHYAESLSLSTLAAKYYRNPSYLSRAFKERYHVSIMNFIAETRIEQAKIFLKTTDWRVCKIAHAVGYPDEKYFCRVFKKISGLSPADFRNL